MSSIIKEISLEELSGIVKNSFSIREVQVNLGYRPSSGTVFYLVRNKIKEYGIDTSHFGSKKEDRLSVSGIKHTSDLVFIKNSKYKNIWSLKKRILREGLLDYICKECGNEGVWNNKPMTLQLDHINGDPSDHRLSNLRFLCPNCHSQTENFCGRNRFTSIVSG